ncbi:UDP-N-acetylmuramate dehydrogenase [Atopobiaceae bacterium 24-176]
MSLFNAFLTLSGAYDADVVRDEPLSRRTSLRVGGAAALSCRAHSYAALTKVLAVLDHEGVPFAVMGKGSNILVSDDGYEGCIVSLGREFSRIVVDVERGTLSAGAGVPLARVLNAAYQSGLSGLEDLAGIPGTLGGAVAMDAGSRHHWIGSAVKGVVCAKPGEGLVRHEGSDIDWGYRRTSIPADETILEVELSLSSSDKPQVARAMDRRLAVRKGKVPMGTPSTGEVFLDPPDASASRLLADAGLKGARSGGAQVSPNNPNYVVNDGSARATDVLALLHTMQETVEEVAGVKLKPQVKFLGF